jgi:tetratricopeptide (TPR) repeat protein
VGKDRPAIFDPLSMKLILFLAVLLSLTGCSFLGVHVVHDSLTAAQHNDLGVTYEGQNKLKLAEKEYKRAIKKDTAWYVPYFNLGNVYFKLSDTDKAVKYYRSGLKKNPDNPEIMNNLAYSLLEMGDYVGAKKWIEKAIAVEPRPEFLDTQAKIRMKMNEN